MILWVGDRVEGFRWHRHLGKFGFHRLTSSTLLALCLLLQGTGCAEAQQAAWEVAAGGRMEFEVASVRLADPDHFISPSFSLSVEDEPIPRSSDFVADFTLPTFIAFAYKVLLTPKQEQVMVSHLPKWVGEQEFVIHAKLPRTDASKDQIRLMMQALLRSRFKLAVHIDSQDQPALALVQVKPGKVGKRIRPHAEGLPCDAKWVAPVDRDSAFVAPGGFLPSCGAFNVIDTAKHTLLFGARDVTMKSLAANLGIIPMVSRFSRPVVDGTEMAGTFDFSLEFSPERGDGSTDVEGTSFEEALRDQLGLKLKPTHAEIQTIVIDHVEELSPN